MQIVARLIHAARRPQYDQSGDGLTHEQSVLQQKQDIAMSYVWRCTQLPAYVMNSKYAHSWGVHGPDYLDQFGALGPFGQSGFECSGRLLNKDINRTSSAYIWIRV